MILNMHLHWKKHQTLKVVVKTFSPEDVKEIAAELARLTGGIVPDIHEDDTIMMYRGKNYSQPLTEIMSPRVSLSRKKAWDKSKCRYGLRAVRRYIPRLGQEIEMLQAQLKSKTDSIDSAGENQKVDDNENTESGIVTKFKSENADIIHEIINKNSECPENEADMGTELDFDFVDLSYICEFEIDSDTQNKVKEERPLYLDKFEKFPDLNDGEIDDFEEHLRQMSERSKNPNPMEDEYFPKFDAVDRIVLRAAPLLKKKRT